MLTGGVLSGIRVLDFSRVLAGPFATRIMGDFGAEIIKVQTARTATGAEAQDSPYFSVWNRNKLSICLNMSLPESRQLALDLAAVSDVVIENFSPRVMANWGLTYEAFCRVKPDIIMASMSAMGHTGPWKDYTAYAPTIHSLAGHTALNSYTTDDPMGLGFSMSDIAVGLYGALTVLAALEHRHKTGQGRYIDLSQYEAACTLLGPALSKLGGKCGPSTEGNRYDTIPAAPYGCYPCAGKDRWCAIAVQNDGQWDQLCRVMDDPPWARKEPFTSPTGRREHRGELDKHITAWTAGQPAEAVIASLHQAGVPAALVADARDLAQDPHLAARNYFVDIPHPLLGKTTADRSPIRFMGEEEIHFHSAPLLGADNEYVYKKVLGLSDEDYEGYRDKGVIA